MKKPLTLKQLEDLKAEKEKKKLTSQIIIKNAGNTKPKG